MFVRHIGPAFSTITLVTGARHVHLRADDDLDDADLDHLIDELQRARTEVFGERADKTVLRLTA